MWVVYMDDKVRLVHLQMDNFCLFLRQQRDKRQTSVCTVSTWVRKIAWDSILHSPFNVSLSPCRYIHIHGSISPCLHVSTSPCLHVSISPCSMSPCLCLHVSVSPSLCLHVHVSMFPEFCKRKTELMENGNFCLLVGNGKRKRQTSICLLQTKNRSLFSLVSKRKTVIDDCCFSKIAHLWFCT
jgi:hypothetical protein